MTARSLESHLATFPSKRLDVRWECWCGATLGFVAYTDTIIDKIEAAWHSPTATGLNISYRHRQYKINFATMEQSNVYTAAVRPIRRVGRRALYGRPRAVRWAVKHDTGVEELDDHCSAALETCLGSVTTFSHASVTPDGVYRLDRIEEPHGSIVGSINAAPVAFARRGKPGEVTLLPPSTVAVTTAAQRDSIIEDETFALANARVIPRVPLAQRVLRKLSHPEFYYHTTKSIYTGEETPAYPYEGSEFMVYPKQPPKGEPLRESITFAMLDHRTRGMSTVYRLGEKMLWHGGTDVSDFLRSKPKPNQEWPADVEETVCNSSQYVTHANKENRAFLVHDFFTEGECDYVMQKAAPHMTPLDQHFPQDYRQSDRAMIASRSMAQEIFHRILPHLGKREVGAEVIPLCFGHLGTWFPHSCNEAIKVNRYRVGGQFAAHRDGPWIPWEDMASIYTLLVYLNDDYEGGETEFLDGPVNVRYGPAPNALVRPERGMALVFNHDAWHAGRPVIAGVKYVLRTEIIFVRPRGIFTKADRYLYATDSTFHQAMQLYEASHAASKRGDSKAFVELYQQVVAMQREAKVKNLELLCGRTRGQRFLPTIPDEVLSHIGSFLRDGDVALLLRLNRASYYSLAHSDIWYHRYVALRATRDGSVTEAYLAGVDWMSEYQKLKEPREMTPVIVFFGGTRVHAAHSCAVQRSSFYWAGEEGFSCWAYGYAQYRTSTSPREKVRSPQDFMETWNLLQMLPGCTPLRDVEPWHMCMLDSDRFRFTPVVDATTNPVATTIHTAAATPSLAAAEWCLIARALAGQVDLLYSIVTLVAHPAWYFYDGPAHDAVPREMWSVSRNKCNYDAPPSSREGHKTAYAEVPPVSVALPAAPLPSLERRDVFLAGALRDLFAASVAPAVAVLDPAECVAAGANVTDAVVVLVSQSFHPQRGGPHALRVTVACYVCLVQNGRLQGMPHAHFAESDTTSTAGREANEIMDGIDKGTETTVLSFPTLQEDEYLTKNNTHAVVVAYLDVPLERLSTPGDDLQIDLDLETTSQALTDAEIVALKSALLQPAARDRIAIPPDVKLAAERERRRRQRTMFKFDDPPKMDFVAAPAAVPEFLVLLENLCGVRAQYDSKFVVKGAAKLATSPLFRRDETRVYYRPDWRRSVHHNGAASPQPSTDAAAA